jgi:glyoxylate reductase
VTGPKGDEATYHAALEQMLPHCDFLSINCALTPETRNLINARTLALLPRGAIVVNTARGGIVEDDALIDALSRGHVAAAGLDVFANEPNIDPRYRALQNVFLLPHLGSATLRTRTNMALKALDNLTACLAGKTPPDKLV